MAENSSFILLVALPDNFDSLDDIASIAEQVQSKRIVVNAVALSACAESLSAAVCANGEPEESNECGAEEKENPFGKIIEGIVDNGGRCDSSGNSASSDDAPAPECAPGFTCSGQTDNGVCVREVDEGGSCQNNEDFDRIAGDLYCEVSDANCTRKSVEGEAYEF